jgi:hypothetical protein
MMRANKSITRSTCCRSDVCEYLLLAMAIRVSHNQRQPTHSTGPDIDFDQIAIPRRYLGNQPEWFVLAPAVSKDLDRAGYELFNQLRDAR